SGSHERSDEVRDRLERIAEIRDFAERKRPIRKRILAARVRRRLVHLFGSVGLTAEIERFALEDESRLRVVLRGAGEVDVLRVRVAAGERKPSPDAAGPGRRRRSVGTKNTSGDQQESNQKESSHCAQRKQMLSPLRPCATCQAPRS